MLLPFVSGDVVSLPITLVVLSRSVDVVLRVLEILDPMGKPSGDSWDCEENWEEVGRESHSFVDQSRVEIDVGV